MDINVGVRIRELREMNGYTRELFAEKIGISSKFLYEIEVGKKGFSSFILLQIAKELSISCDYIMTGEDFGQKGGERINYILEILQPQKINNMQEVLSILAQMCDLVK